MIYTWKESEPRAVSAQLVGEIIAKLEKREGVVRPLRLVDEARPEDSPLHSLFEWTDAVAAESWRMEQARSVIRNIRIVANDEVEPYPAFVSVSVSDAGADGVRGYMSTVDAVENPLLRKQVVADALRQLNGLRKRYESLDELSDVWQSLDRIAAEKDSV